MNEPLMLFLKKLAKNYNKIHSDWAYSKQEVIESVVSDTGRVFVAFVVVGLSLDEQPGKPLRVWVGGYVVQCLVNVVCVLLEYRKRRQRRWQTVSFRSSWLSSLGSDVAKHLGSANKMFSFVWWLLGFYWVYDAGRQLIGASPRLYWLCIGFLACDVFFVVLFIACACVVGIAVCSFLTCIAFLYAAAMAEQEDASED